jgi:uncharacterized membrane protein
MNYLGEEKKSEQYKKLEEEVLQRARKKPSNKQTKARIDEKQHSLIELGWILLVIGFILLVFGFGSQQWIYEQRINSIFISMNSYYFWGNIETLRQFCIPLSILLIIAGGAILFYQMNIPRNNDSLNTLKLRYAKGEITKEQYELMKKDLET